MHLPGQNVPLSSEEIARPHDDDLPFAQIKQQVLELDLTVDPSMRLLQAAYRFLCAELQRLRVASAVLVRGDQSDGGQAWSVVLTCLLTRVLEIAQPGRVSSPLFKSRLN